MKKLFVALFLLLAFYFSSAAQTGTERSCISEEEFLEMSEYFCATGDGSGVIYIGEVRAMTYLLVDGRVFSVNFTKDFKTKAQAKKDYEAGLKYFRSFMLGEVQIEDNVWLIRFYEYGVYVKLNKKRVVFEFFPMQ